MALAICKKYKEKVVFYCSCLMLKAFTNAILISFCALHANLEKIKTSLLK
jgi:hypothetical protein